MGIDIDTVAAAIYNNANRPNAAECCHLRESSISRPCVGRAGTTPHVAALPAIAWNISNTVT